MDSSSDSNYGTRIPAPAGRVGPVAEKDPIAPTKFSTY
eukprot:SAG31_NODE_2981_length_4829_cov_1.746089_1_plen_38_part_00